VIFELIVRPTVEMVQEAGQELAREVAEEPTRAMAALFEQLDEDCTAAAEELVERTGDLFEAGASFATDELRPAVESGIGSLLEDAFAPLAGAQSAVADLLESGSSLLEVVSGLAPPVDWARGVVDTINSLLDAMNLGL
jgi:hypothetical protein